MLSSEGNVTIQFAADAAADEDPEGVCYVAPVATTARSGWRRYAIEVVVLGVMYEIYKLLRAACEGSSRLALHNGLQIVRAEQLLGLFQEQRIQRALLGHPFYLQAADLYYGTVHFVAPVMVLVWLARRDQSKYRWYRNVLIVTTGLALVGFALYPLAPPRLLPATFHFVDTSARFGGEGVLNQGSMKDVDNLYAAMPSLHIAWSIWCALAVWSITPRRVLRAAAVFYPLVTLFVVVVTANHYFLDAVGGLVTLALAWYAAAGVQWLQARRTPPGRVVAA
jgi:hypothetical protein